jgi:hypothetical protein
VACHARDERRLGRGERLPVVRAQERQATPGDVVVDERGAELVAEAVGAPDLAVAPAAVEVVAGRRAQGGRRPGGAGERPERVEVVAAHLDLRHPRRRLGREAVLDDLAGRQERRGVHREHADAVERDRAGEDPGGVAGELGHRGPAVKQPDQLVSEALG